MAVSYLVAELGYRWVSVAAEAAVDEIAALGASQVGTAGAAAPCHARLLAFVASAAEAIAAVAQSTD